MNDPFDSEEASYLVLANHLGQHSLWPEAIEVPSGWRVVFSGGGRQECLAYVAANWTDIAPKTPVAVPVPRQADAS
ncbi:MbtH family protein [Actinomadura barringtoniae]|uniref:MbtH family protein n=1 Tax=Actinomadura barringtoniae TaxID=1427535 RepID=A0A939PGT6_9ACTN|nr:MbtH family protein [Actinomadura barringtoniae]MBO2449474.1 MbtH family protein [Actinomadura barringtoniae]